MKFKLFAVLTFAAFAIQFVTPVLADKLNPKLEKARINQLVSMLPASDGVFTLNTSRMMNEALPRILASNQPMLAEAMAKIESMQQKTGIDFKSFDHVAAGVNATPIDAKNYEVEPVVIARGRINTDSIIAAAKKAAEGKYREERFDGKVLYIFSVKEIADAKTTDDQKAKAGKWYGKIVNSSLKEMALTVLNAETIAFGTTARVRETIEGKTKVAPDVLELLGKREIAVMNMAAKVPAGMDQFLPIEADDLGTSIKSIRYMYGSMDMAGDAAVMNLSARTDQAKDAQMLFETLEGLKAVGGMLLGNAQRPDQKLYGRLINAASISRNGTDISLDIRIPQSDMDALVSVLVK